MNCFQICIFVSDDTALYYLSQSMRKLWIAFKFVSLYRMTQLADVLTSWDKCCELLSNLYLCIGWHSGNGQETEGHDVVNCFQICIFVSDDTAYKLNIITTIALWIAFKFVSLYRMTQHDGRKLLLIKVIQRFRIKKNSCHQKKKAWTCQAFFF